MHPSSPTAQRYWCDATPSPIESQDLDFGELVVFTRASPEHPDRNEDAAAVYRTAAGAVVAVADGVGGLPGAAAASRTALEAIGSRLARPARDPRPDERLRDALLDGIEHAHECLLEAATGATTLAAVELRPGSMRSYHVGDSAVLVFGPGGDLIGHTVPHSPIGYAFESGLIDELEALHHPSRNVIFRCLGRDRMALEISWPLRLAAGDTVLLATDGLLDNLTQSEIADACTSHAPAQAVERLVDEATRRMLPGSRPGHPSKPDDLTLALFRAH